MLIFVPFTKQLSHPFDQLRELVDVHHHFEFKMLLTTTLVVHAGQSARRVCVSVCLSVCLSICVSERDIWPVGLPSHYLQQSRRSVP